MTQVVLFPAFTTSPPRIFFWVASSTVEANTIVANGSKTFLAKGTLTFINGPANFPKKASKHPPN